MSKHWCSCKPKGKNFHIKFREVEVDAEGICNDCGYYALKVNPHKSYNLREKRWEDTEEYKNQREDEMGNYFIYGK